MISFLTKNNRSIDVIWSMIRPKTSALLGLHVALAFGYIEKQKYGNDFWGATSIHNQGLIFITLILLTIVWYVNATLINDLADYKIDKINLKSHKDRLLVNKSISSNQIKILYMLSIIIVLLFSLVGGVILVAWSILMLVLNYIYSMPPLRISYRGFLAQGMLPIGYVGMPLISTFITLGGNWDHNFVVLLIGLYLVFIARVTLKDFRDIEGDKQFGKITFTLRHSAKFVTDTSMLFFVSSQLLNIYLIYKLSNKFLGSIFAFVLLIVGLKIYTKLRTLNKWPDQSSLISFIGRICSLSSILLLETVIYFSGAISYSIFEVCLAITLFALINTVYVPYINHKS